MFLVGSSHLEARWRLQLVNLDGEHEWEVGPRLQPQQHSTERHKQSSSHRVSPGEAAGYPAHN
jgi:hypothetical protein